MKRHKRKRLLLCDVNGTILDDWPPAYEGSMAVLDYFGVPRPTMEEYVREVGLDGDYRAFYLRRGIPSERDELYELFSPAYCAHTSDIRLMPGVHAAFARMKRKGVEIHILTAARKDFVEPLLVAAGMYDLCDSYHYHVHHKADQVRAVMSGMELEHSACTMAGDLPADVAHAKQAGIRGVGFRNEHIPPDLFSKLISMDYYAFTFEGLADFVLGT